MKRVWSVRALFVGVSLFPGLAQAQYCGPIEFTGNEFPSGNFLSNFNNSCYLIDFATSSGNGTEGSDLNSQYYKMFYKVDPSYEIVILGDFPNTRYFSITNYDTHGAPAGSILDANIVPLTSAYINPYQPGTDFVAGQKYAASIGFEGTPGVIEKGCTTNGFNVEVNGLDATLRHAGMDWNSDSNVFAAEPGFALHIVDTPQHTNPNTAGAVMIRDYLNITPASYAATPHFILRDVASGCAYPAAYALNVLQVVANSAATGNAWLDSTQADLHRVYEKQLLPRLCYATDTRQVPAWNRGTEYLPGADPDGTYMNATFPAGVPQNLATEGRVMRIRYRIPTTPPTPCTDGCSRSGNEELRYLSLSFEDVDGNTLASVADNAFTENPNGYVTLIAGTGTAIPSWITPANGYTFLDLTAISGYQNLNSLNLRNILQAATFNCSGAAVPYRTNEYTPAGGLMGEYLPVVDYPTAASLPQVAAPLVQADSCGVFPDNSPAVLPACGLDPFPAMALTAVTTQCAAPGCNHVVAQAQPPMSVIGGGFGNFPKGLPYTGSSNYLGITDTTQNWSAGYSGDPCTVSISGWDNDLIELVANVNQNGLCPLVAGDQLTVNVWNPQSMATAALTVTVAAN
ncbi:MAG: hypothetical protein ABSH24_24780 [Bryobacteraceae bacterium]|jgi:hypothetical protein